MRISAAQRTENENRIRAAMDRLLRGEIPPGGKCDIKTLAREAGVDRTAFYGSRPYARLREEFEAKLAATVQEGDTPDPRDAQIGRASCRERVEISVVAVALKQKSGADHQFTGRFEGVEPGG